MTFLSNDVPFHVHIRPDPASDGAIIVRFEVSDGMGILGLRKAAEDPQPAVHQEQDGVETELLRAGRFVHVLGSGQRQSYALSRVTTDAVLRLPADTWTELEAVTEYGFRYLVVPKAVLERVPEAAAVMVGAPVATPSPAPPRAAPAQAPAVAQRGRVEVTPGPPPQRAAVPRQVPMEPTLAELALDRLDRQEAVAFLRSEMAKVEKLHLRVVELEEALAASRAREQDLLEVLQRWQQR